ncbi:L-lactate dehydrogenase [Georgenia satyanarayanai]|uniref:L-lactate dehydrogenase n=1 Tax=Georgenia satyanarayanai TaxID=860221 RepID=A0A2Y9ACA8_9MICO|nr:L-lactate dehydrogenase [Georgenia satyanarayanai]PYF99851.1 L-lactate dehydrogenase [Georgenia satyanarayanai]SSA41835.1 L-lactate dehydrogenase [Georgenia satyanarayanai]
MARAGASTVAIVGAGAVGATLAYALLMQGVARRVVLHDVNRAKVEAEALDLAHGIQFMPHAQIIGSDDVEVCRDADVVVITAGAKQRPGQTRLDLAASTVGLMRTLVPRLTAVAPDATFLMVTNPVDIVTQAALAISGLPREQLFGSGTVLDTSRLRYRIAQETGIAASNVHAYVVGEHGDSELVLWSSAMIGAVPLLDWSSTHAPLLDEPSRRAIAEEVVTAAYKIIEGKGATNYAVALAAVGIIQAVLRAENRVLPVSTLLTDYAGISDVCLSVPTVVGGDGAQERLMPPMTPHEQAGLRASAERIRAVARELGV